MSSVPRVLLVDDDLEFCRLMEHLLKKFGVQVATTRTPEDFLKRLKREKFDLALVDLNMGRDAVGNLVIQAVRRVLGPEVPLYIVSASQGIHHYRSALAAGANDYILKPLDRKLLAAKFSQHFVTQEMAEWLDSQTDVPEGLERGHVSLPLRVLEVNEGGFKVFSPHLVVRGTRFAIEGETVRAFLSGFEGRIEVVVREVWRDRLPAPLGEGYIHLLDLDGSKPDALRALRVWLMKWKVDTAIT
jgi:CheY-like chemotaxis protein